MAWPNIPITLPITDPTWIFLWVLLIILFAPIVFDRLKIPHIIGMILAGLLVGPHGLNILERDSSFELFGKVGLFFIMFLAGLEMDMNGFRKNKNGALMLGIACFMIPILFGFIANRFYLGYGLATSVLLASMYASNTQVSYPIVLRYGASEQRSVSMAVGGTAVTDTLTLLVLAVIGGMYKGETSDLFLIWLIIKVVVLGSFIVFTFPRVARWFFRRYSDSVMQFIFVLFMVFLGAALMQFVGMEGILGAFLTGLVLNRYVPRVSPLMNHLEFVGNAIFIPYFLIGVGMLINLRVVFSGQGVIKVAMVMISMALIGKALACLFTRKVFRLKPLEGWLIYGLSTAQAAATLAAVTVGYNIIQPNGERLLSEEVLNGTILLILVTCLVSSFITEKSVKRITMDPELLKDSASNNDASGRVLVPISNPDNVGFLMDLALVIRDQKYADNLVILNVMDDREAEDGAIKAGKGKQSLAMASKIANAANVNVTEISRYDNNVATGIIRTAREYDVVNVLIGLHHKANLGDSFLGNLSKSLLRGLHRQVMIARILTPVSTLRRVVVVVPPNAEYETGFYKWIKQLSRMAKALDYQVSFYSSEPTLGLIQQYIFKKWSKVNVRFVQYDNWPNLEPLREVVHPDHLLAIVSSRYGSVSYSPSFEKIPSQLTTYFADHSFIVIYPDCVGDPTNGITVFHPMGSNPTNR